MTVRYTGAYLERLGIFLGDQQGFFDQIFVDFINENTPGNGIVMGNEVITSQGIQPAADSTENVGAPGLFYANGYFDDIHLGNVPPSSALYSDTNGIIEGVQLTDGQLLIGDTGGLPLAGNITSLDGTLVVNNGPGTIDLSVAVPVSNIFNHIILTDTTNQIRLQQGPNLVNISCTPSGSYTFEIPDVGASEFVMTAGNQLIGGFKEFSSFIEAPQIQLNTTSNQIQLGNVNLVTITLTPTATYTLTIPDTAGPAQFVMTEVAQTINGAKTLTTRPITDGIQGRTATTMQFSGLATSGITYSFQGPAAQPCGISMGRGSNESTLGIANSAGQYTLNTISGDTVLQLSNTGNSFYIGTGGQPYFRIANNLIELAFNTGTRQQVLIRPDASLETNIDITGFNLAFPFELTLSRNNAITNEHAFCIPASPNQFISGSAAGDLCINQRALSSLRTGVLGVETMNISSVGDMTVTRNMTKTQDFYRPIIGLNPRPLPTGTSNTQVVLDQTSKTNGEQCILFSNYDDPVLSNKFVLLGPKWTSCGNLVASTLSAPGIWYRIPLAAYGLPGNNLDGNRFSILNIFGAPPNNGLITIPRSGIWRLFCKWSVNANSVGNEISCAWARNATFIGPDANAMYYINNAGTSIATNGFNNLYYPATLAPNASFDIEVVTPCSVGDIWTFALFSRVRNLVATQSVNTCWLVEQIY